MRSESISEDRYDKHRMSDAAVRVRYRWTSAKDGVETEEVSSDIDAMLAVLLLEEKVSLNSHWWRDDWPEDAREVASLLANCNDVFEWGCSDAESMTYADIERVYEFFEKDPVWGVEVWAMTQRREMPQRPVEKSIRDKGVWDFDRLRAEYGLRPNAYDGITRVLSSRKYGVYARWVTANGGAPLPFDAQWWSGWRQYTAANPGWNDPAWIAEDQRLIAEWEAANGYSAGESAA